MQASLGGWGARPGLLLQGGDEGGAGVLVDDGPVHDAAHAGRVPQGGDGLRQVAHRGADRGGRVVSCGGFVLCVGGGGQKCKKRQQTVHWYRNNMLYAGRAHISMHSEQHRERCCCLCTPPSYLCLFFAFSSIRPKLFLYFFCNLLFRHAPVDRREAFKIF